MILGPQPYCFIFHDKVYIWVTSLLARSSSLRNNIIACKWLALKRNQRTWWNFQRWKKKEGSPSRPRWKVHRVCRFYCLGSCISEETRAGKNHPPSPGYRSTQFLPRGSGRRRTGPRLIHTEWIRTWSLLSSGDNTRLVYRCAAQAPRLLISNRRPTNHPRLIAFRSHTGDWSARLWPLPVGLLLFYLFIYFFFFT